MPGLHPVTLPSLLTVATFLSLDDHVIARAVLFLPICIVSPTTIWLWGAVTDSVYFSKDHC